MSEPLIRNVSDTARWVAVYRADESARPDALFRDPYAKRLAGERGEQIANGAQIADAPGFQRKNAWPFVARTVAMDEVIAAEVARGADTVVNLAAGLDARPYRMALPAALQWIEVDLPGILDYKEEVLRDEEPACALERVRLDLANVEERRALFAQLGGRAKKALVVSEGLLIYLTAEEVGALARDLAATAGFQRWLLDLVSPGLLQMMQRQMGKHLEAAHAPHKFGPPEGPAFFAPHGWKPAEVRSILKTAARIKRLPFLLRLLALLPESNGPQGNRMWSGVCLLEKSH